MMILAQIAISTINLWWVPCTHAQGVQFCPSVCLPISTKITRSGDLGMWATRKHNESVEIVKNWLHYASNHLAGPTSFVNAAFYWPLLSTLPTTGHVLSAHAWYSWHNLAYHLAQYVGKGRQQVPCLLLQLSSLCRYMQCSACRVCALESSGYVHGVCICKRIYHTIKEWKLGRR
jgi:hypothetical protein